MINDEAKNCYYFAVKSLLELDSLGWLRGRKEAIVNGDNTFQKSLDDALNYKALKHTWKEYQIVHLMLMSIIGK